MVKINQENNFVGKALSFTRSDVENIRSTYKVDEKTIKRDVTILKNWIKQQKHLPQTADDEFLERCLLNNKFQVEKTKRKLDDYYTMRGIHRQYYQQNNSKFLPSKSKNILVPLPVLTPDKVRLVFMKVDPDPESYDQVEFTKYCNLHFELLLKYDYSLGLRFIFDCADITLDHAKKLSVAHFSNSYLLFKNSYSGRLVGLEMINPPKFISIFMAIFKLALPAKFYDKFNVINDKDALLESIPRECLPKDFGGDLDSLEDLTKNYWDPIFRDHMGFFEDNVKNVSNEALRVGETPNSGLSFGVEGTFKRLNLD